jgi:hypothetical protein
VKSNPFSAYGTIASDDRFVGRELACTGLTRRLYEARSSAAIVGLSRIGKSSLAQRVVELAPAGTWLTGWATVSTADSGAELLREILTIIPSPTAEISAVLSVSSSTSVHDAYRAVRAALLDLRKSNHHLMVVLDEFDAVRNFRDARAFLNILRELVYDPSRLPMAVLAVARRPIDHIEVEAADISTFAGVCDSIYIGPMEFDEVVLMSARAPDLPNDSIDFVWRHAGGQPFLSELIFSRIFEEGNADVEYLVQPDLTTYYSKLRSFLEKEQLWYPLLQLALGPVLDVSVEQNMLIKQYGLVNQQGDVWSKDFAVYLRFSAIELDAWGIFGSAEVAVREFVASVLHTGLGPNWLEQLEKKHSQVAAIVNESSKRRAQDARKFPAAAQRPLLDYSYPIDLWTLMSAEWQRFSLLEPRKGKDFWRSRLVSLSEIRAPLAHHRDDVIPDEKKVLIRIYCRELEEATREYMALGYQ